MNEKIHEHTKVFNYSNKKIYYHYWSHIDNSKPDTIIFLGTFQIGKIPKWVTKAAPPGVVVVQGLPHWESHPSAQDLKDFSINYSETALKSILSTYKISSVNIIAQSQAVPGAIVAALNNFSSINNISLMAPLGFTSQIFGKTMKERINKLRLRSLYTLFQLSQSPFYDLRNAYICLMLLKAVLSESKIGASDKKYATGLSYDMLEKTRLLADKLWKKGKLLTIFLGEKDKIFPPIEIIESLKTIDTKHIKTVIIPNLSHSSLAIRGSSKILNQIIITTRGK